MGFANLRTWESAVNQQGNLTREAIKRATGNVAKHAAERIREGVPPGGSGAFPGYAATGALKAAITAGPVVVTGDTYRSVVAVRGGAKVQMYATVHEYGKVITARRAPYLVFKIGDKWIRTKQVRIRPKHFFESGWNAARAEFAAVLQRELAG